MVIKIGEMSCLFCDSPICLIDGDMVNYHTHLEYEHEVKVAKQELVLAMSFLSENEAKKLINKVKPRTEYFIEHGEQLLNCDIFDGEVIVEASTHVKELQIDQIQQLLNDEFSDDSEEESGDGKDDKEKVQIEPTPARILEENIKKEGDTEEESVEKLLQENSYRGATMENESSSKAESCGKSEFKKNSQISVKPCNILMKKWVTEYHQLDADNNLGDEKLSLEKDDITIKPCNIIIKKWAGESQPGDDVDQMCKNGFNILEDEDLNPQQEQILQNVTCKMEIVENEVDEVHREDPISAPEINNINLVEKLASLNHCRLCFSSFSNRGNLKKHEETVHEDDKEALNLSFFTLTDLVYHCNMCPQIPGFLTENILNTHKRLQHRVKVKNTVIKCEICLKVVKYHGMKAHLLTHTVQEKKHECNLCYKKFLKPCYLQKHQKSVHSNVSEYFSKHLTEADLNFKCEVCNLKFLTESILKYHSKCHVKRVVHNCPYCSTSFENPKLFKIHCIKVHGKRATLDGSDKKFRCKLCYTGFSEPRGLQAHQKIHREDQEAFEKTLEDGDLKSACNECDQRFVSNDVLKYHINKIHRELEFEELRKTSKIDGIYKCKLCYTTFKHFTSLNSHTVQNHQQEKTLLQREIGDADLAHPCDECELKFVTGTVLDYHKSRVHTKDQEHQCKLCYKMFKKRSNLISHQERVHKNESHFLNRDITASDLKYCCSECDKKFVSQVLLKAHSRIHQAQKFEFLRQEAFDVAGKVFRCKLCYTEFKYFSDFICHTGSIHKEDVDLLQRQIKDEELVHPCTECDQRFLSETLLDYHSSKSHFDQFTKNCKLCDLEFKTNGGFLLHKYQIHRQELAEFTRNHEEKDQTFGCKKCSKKFVTQISLNHHVSRKHKAFMKKKSSSRKKLKVKVENLEKYCQLCHIVYKEPKYLRVHKQKIHADEMDAFNKDLSSEDMNHECVKCHKSFYSQNTLNYHMQRKHKKYSGTNNFECKLCHVGFTFNSTLKKHFKVVHKNDLHLLEGDLEEMHACKLCDEKFVADHILKYHLKYQHKEKDKHTFCKLCFVDFKHSSHLKAHKNNVHTAREEIEAFDVKMERSSLPHECKFCSERFLTENILKYHNLYSHKEERRQDMNCEFCNKVFKWSKGRKKVMKNHMKNLHNLDDYTVDEQEPAQKENDTVKNFMLLLNSLK